MTEGTNSVGGRGYLTTSRLLMRAYDRLPPLTRQALANAVDNWAPQPILTRIRRGRYTDQTAAAMVTRWDAAERAVREKQRRGARGPYAGNAPDPGVARRDPPPRRANRDRHDG